MKEKLQWPETLRALMLARGGLSNPALGREIKVSHVTIGNYLDGQFPKGDDLAALADFFCVSTDALLGRAEISTGRCARCAMMEERVEAAESELVRLRGGMRELLGSKPISLARGGSASSAAAKNLPVVGLEKLGAEEKRNR